MRQGKTFKTDLLAEGTTGLCKFNFEFEAFKMNITYESLACQYKHWDEFVIFHHLI